MAKKIKYPNLPLDRNGKKIKDGSTVLINGESFHVNQSIICKSKKDPTIFKWFFIHPESISPTFEQKDNRIAEVTLVQQG